MGAPDHNPAETQDQRTRGRTRPGRLRALDAYLAHAERDLLLAPGHALVVDVGVGEHPWTTLEFAAALRAVNPGLSVLGVDLEPHRVLAAQDHANGNTHFRLGGFHLPLQAGEEVRLLRAMNLLRAYPPAAVPGIHQRLGQQLLPGGLLVEGSSDAQGAVVVAHLLRATGSGLRREGLLFHTDFSRGFAPRLMRDWLPRDLRRRVKPGEWVHGFFQTWTSSWEAVRAGRRREAPEAFRLSVLELATRERGVSTDPWLLAQGTVTWCPPGAVPP
jgi:hypothetical protein